MKLNNIKDLEVLKEQIIINTANNMMEMANFYDTTTGIPYAIWFGKVGGQHGPRIKVSNVKGTMSDDCFVMSVSKTPVVLTPKSVKVPQDIVNNITDWIVLNYDILMQLWEMCETGTGDWPTLATQLQKI